MTNRGAGSGADAIPPASEAGGGPGAAAGDGAPAFVQQLLADSADAGAMQEGDILTWSGGVGTLADGRMARAGFSCLVRPAPGDHVLVWPGDPVCWVLAILERRSEVGPAVIAVPGAAALEASRIALAAESVHIAAGDLLTSARNVQAVADTRTETSRLRVTQVGTDIRRAGHADDAVDGTLLQRVGTWVSTTVRDARLTARSFLFN